MPVTAVAPAMAGGPNGDAVLVTIDCFRDDALGDMPNLRSVVEDGAVRTSAIAPSSSTPFASPALLQSRHFWDVLRKDGGSAETRYSVDDAVPSLPRVLEREGYATAGFVAANPFLTQYAEHFQEFWNGPSTGDGRLPDRLGSGLAQLRRLLLLEKRVPAADLVERAREWYESTEGPRFLWLHFMEPHFPYYPGLGRGRRVGLLRAYRANLRLFRSDNRTDELPERDVRTLRALYRECLGSVDEALPDVLGFVDDDALVTITGDHGEGFDHGVIGHSGLYDETVAVPLVLGNYPEGAVGSRTIRHVDVPATILDGLGLSPPESWAGVPAAEDRRLEAVLARSGSIMGTSTTAVALRTSDRKLIRQYDFERGEFVGEELYDLAADPDESTDRSGAEDASDLRSRLDAIVEQRDLLTELERFEDGIRTDHEVSQEVEDRLSELGYT